MKEREAAGNVWMDTIEGDGSHSQSPYLITKVFDMDPSLFPL